VLAKDHQSSVILNEFLHISAHLKTQCLG